MKAPQFIGLTIFLGLLVIAASPGGKDRGKGGPGGGAAVEPAITPDYVFNTWLCRPGDDSITVSILSWKDMELYIHFGEKANALSRRSETVKIGAGEAKNLVLNGLKADTGYFYQVNYRLEGGESAKDHVRGFHTRRAPTSAYTFVVQADSHLDINSSEKVYQQTLTNMKADKPDFLVDLGDTTMVDKFGNLFTRAESQYRAQRFYIGQVAHSAPVFLTLGNHDGEQGSRLNGTADSMPLWSLGMRKKYFPNPEPGGIYSGNTTPRDKAGLLQNYYSWEWGGALFLVLDPFWSTTQRKRDDNWDMTLGSEQYRWLKSTLEASKAPFKFVFIHHLVGGLGRDVRGGISAAPYMEWGGKNADGSEGFAQHRPGWERPTHQLLVKHGVSIVFHGHDHLFVKEQLDGIIYQEVPQPSHPNGGTRSAEEYGYKGVVLGSSGHLRVRVEPKQATVEYVRAAVAGVTAGDPQNATVAHRYTIAR